MQYLFKRPGSQHWWIKLQSPSMPGQKKGRVEKSLGTTDRREAEVIALPMIAEHKAKLLAARPRIESAWRHDYEPGREHAGPDGSRIIATDRELLHLDGEGRITGRTANGGPEHRIINLDRRLGIPYAPIEVTDKVRPTLAVRTGDDKLFETYLEHANITGYYEREARAVWALYKQLTDNKPLKDADRDDGRRVAKHFMDQGLKSATVRKKLMWLVAAVNLAIEEGKDGQPNRLTFNPFVGVVPDLDDDQTREPLSDSDIKLVKRNLDKLSGSDQLLFRVLATTGMRLSEAFEIEGEMKERAVRFVIVGTKTEQSRRRVPFPASLLPHLATRINGTLFKGGAKAASKRLNRFLNDIGITADSKVIHSLRHRAQDRLRAAECPEDIRWALLGHEKKTVAGGYGKGFSVPQLKKWIDKIGF